MKKLLLLTVLSLGFLSCNDDEPQAFGPNQTIVGFAEGKSTKPYLTDVPSASLNVPISLIGFANEALPAGEVVVNWSIDPSSTAIDGVEYTIDGPQVTSISAGNTTGTANFLVYPTTFDSTAPKTIVINLTTVVSNNAIIGEQFKKIVVTLQGVCNSQLQGNYSNYTTIPAFGNIYTFPDEVWIKREGTVSDYYGNHVGRFYGTAQVAGGPGQTQLAVPIAYLAFTDVCDKIKLNQQFLADNPGYSNIVTQDATQYAASFVDPDTGIVTIHYSVWFSNNTVERKHVGVYTPQ